jgi:hypothetical protein
MVKLAPQPQAAFFPFPLAFFLLDGKFLTVSLLSFNLPDVFAAPFFEACLVPLFFLVTMSLLLFFEVGIVTAQRVLSCAVLSLHDRANVFAYQVNAQMGLREVKIDPMPGLCL